MTNSILNIDNASVKLGSSIIVNELNLTIPPQTVFGFLGKNGAGKTTTMKAILGLIPLHAGAIYVNGEQVSYGQTATNRYIGYLPDVPHYFDYMNPLEYLSLCGEIVGMDSSELKLRSNQLLARVGIDNVKKNIGSYSRGMKQRLGIAQALLHKPKLIICDEPTSALDPIGRKEILDLLGSLKDEAAVMFSTHILSDIERICDHIAILHNGKVQIEGSIYDIQSQAPHQDGLILTFKSSNDASIFAKLWQAQHYDSLKTEQAVVTIYGAYDAVYRAVLPLLIESGLYTTAIEKLSLSLESIFVEVIQQ